MKRNFGYWMAAAAVCAGFAGPALAIQPVTVRPAVFGTVREVMGAQLLTVTPTANCSAAGRPLVDGPCFDKVKDAISSRARVLSLNHPVQSGDRFTGVYGQDYMLYDVVKGPHGLEVRAMDLPTSDVMAPRNCYALQGEDVAYYIGANGPDVAQEGQMVSCDGGPRAPHGPYQDEAPPIPPGGQNTWHRTEMAVLEGDRRYLAYPATCDAQYSIKTTYCAQAAVAYLQANPDVKELDLIAALHPVKPGDVLGKKDIDQWVLKRKGTHGSFKADSRWFDKTMMRAVDGCSAVEDVTWRVDQQSDGLYVVEQAMNRCGAPLAPIPADIVEAYGYSDYDVVVCNRGHDHGSDCMDDAASHIRKGRSETVVVLDHWARGDDHLSSGDYTMVQIKVADDGSYKIENDYSSDSISLANCSTFNDGGPNESGIYMVSNRHAVAYQWMSCPVY